MKTKKLAYIPIEVLWAFREFKRDEAQEPKAAFMNMHTIEEITEYVRFNGLEPLELSIVGEKALLTDGNHRIVAAKQLGYQEVPVFVMVYLGQENDIVNDKHAPEHFKPTTKELEIWLKNLFLYNEISVG